jgi:hypothetical protein
MIIVRVLKEIVKCFIFVLLFKTKLVKNRYKMAVRIGLKTRLV